MREIVELFIDAGCHGRLCVREVDGTGRVDIGAAEPVIAASSRSRSATWSP